MPKRDPKGCPRSSKVLSFEKILKEWETRKVTDSPIQVFETFDEDLFPWRLSDEARAVYDRTFVLAGNSCLHRRPLLVAKALKGNFK